jgi:isopentenyldiphosphate isomerase
VGEVNPSDTDRNEAVVIVDEHDVVVGEARRGRLDPATQRCRVVALWVTDESGRVLLAHRRSDRDRDAGRWAPAVTGHVCVGESYLDAVRRETAQELGVEVGVEQLDVVFTGVVDTPESLVAVGVFRCEVGNDVRVVVGDPAEVDELRWWSPEELAAAPVGDPDRFVAAAVNLAPLLL